MPTWRDITPVASRPAAGTRAHSGLLAWDSPNVLFVDMAAQGCHGGPVLCGMTSDVMPGAGKVFKPLQVSTYCNRPTWQCGL